MKKDMRYLCYPFMRESASTVDFEIRTDSLTTRIGEAIAVNDVPQIIDDLRYLQPMVYHLNGSVRGKLAITEQDLADLSSLYDRYVAEVKEEIDQFVLPQGTHGACILHVCRSEAKKSVRALHYVTLERAVPEHLMDYANLLANVFFVMAVYANKQHGVDEIPFVSKSYPTKRMKKKETHS
ncbi:hypothetical protein KQ939_09120 [Planococcus sp. CP5-4]|uniref:hypothetical protein n=1 Tax=unclassified Planococcus (in: firmicutes) TaxID=2662419 RepID=UPI001C2221A2|nr:MULTISPECIES: hypothetical protein [unclassified Planococcus (in: firmicutes)]MBU9674727.1 hypothetical protein [Planococcus sp. CP5-4_YE]MBV0910352.1 hypothetical protein [Planococcus sp. CP5-4_UN]MBW6063872.1 hypothetical protein [Planococcus sp. CP5-4]